MREMCEYNVNTLTAVLHKDKLSRQFNNDLSKLNNDNEYDLSPIQ